MSFLTKTMNTFSLASIDFILNINTRLAYQSNFEELKINGTFQDMVKYEAMHYFHLHHIFKTLEIKETDVFADIGCGMGRVTCFAGLFSFKKVIGIDLDKKLCNLATLNAQGMRFRNAHIEIIHSDALKLNQDEITVFYFYNPFGTKTMAKFLNRLEDSLKQKPRNIQIIYVNPICRDIFETNDWLKCTGEFVTKFSNQQVVTYWRNIEPLPF